ncbi:biopolymer transport protein [Synechococcus sp. PCC 7502]|uniref:MotA/TolQ/ExbB proton channel family protein n=1 Tax=Synechococcus sp. PCC 7502 TaxID=1173263 RepID=UPI00029FB797|nr:MotA/TolQ/ExbB proton channel family protein [Synechococcus sp. PCC 7502]AFY72819.1 biopolymer transport protein [Synechococcus sp. PCC 7502]
MGDLFKAGGPVMLPLMALSVMAITVIAERSWFWITTLINEKQTASQILITAYQDFDRATQIAKLAEHTPIGRFLLAPLALIKPDSKPDPELFRLALENNADDELASMMRGDKILEGVISLAPLLGLLGTVIGLIVSFSNLKVGDIASNARSSSITQGIGEALISTATGLVVSIITLAFHRLFLALHSEQIRLFRRAGNDLELIYRQRWQNQDL